MSNLLHIAPLRDVMQEYLRREWIPLGNDYSVTDLLKPPRVVQLEKRYRDVLNQRPLTDEDVRSALKAFVGTAVHEKLAKCLWSFSNKNPQMGYFIERKLFEKIHDRRIVGKFDCFLNGALYDWKTTSVWKYIYKQYQDFEDQLNIYAYLLRECGVSVNLLQIILWFTDWNKNKAGVQKDYPKDPIVQVLIEKLWKLKEQKDFIEEKVVLHIENENRQDDDLDSCTSEEIWEKPTTHAVTYPNANRAVRVLDTNAEAAKYIADSKSKDKANWFIEERPGERVRCEQFCRVNEFCCQYKDYCKKQGRI